MRTQANFPKTFSLEFFPPKTPAAAEKLATARRELDALKPRYCSVTFGAGGSTQEGTFDTVVDILRSGVDAAPHISCIGSSKDSIRDLIMRYREAGVRRLVALRGDLPSGMGSPGELHFANELVEFIRQETGDHFHIEVGAYPEVHPQARSARSDLLAFKRKVEAGADAAITQYFFNPDAYIRFVDSCEALGLSIPIVPGVMPIINYTQLARFSDACGAEIPRWLRKRLDEFGDDLESLRAFGIDVTAKLCHDLLEAGAPGLHFYTLNQARATTRIWHTLELDRLHAAA